MFNFLYETHLQEANYEKLKPFIHCHDNIKYL